MGDSNIARVGHVAPSEQKLRFLPKGTALVPHYAEQSAGRRRFHGWKHDATMGPSFLDPETKQPRNHGGFVKQLGLANVIEIPVTSEFRAEYVRHLRDGDLWPADEFTAQQAGVKFDAAFGSEHDEPAAALAKPAAMPAKES